eukprot:s643_g17.t1
MQPQVVEGKKRCGLAVLDKHFSWKLLPWSCGPLAGQSVVPQFDKVPTQLRVFGQLASEIPNGCGNEIAMKIITATQIGRP